MGVEVRMPSDDELRQAVLEGLKQHIEAALSVAKDVPAIIKGKAMLDNEDVDGNQMPAKKPKPKNNPKNFPQVALIQGDEPDMMSPDRWKTEVRDDWSVAVVYTPPEHLKYLLEKDPEKGGRPWIAYDRINPNAQEEIAQEMQRRGSQ